MKWKIVVAALGQRSMHISMATGGARCISLSFEQQTIPLSERYK
jgi:hypothetical protein